MKAQGRLFVIATPIGNLSDLSPRAAESLALATWIAAEDTRRTRKLLSHLRLAKPLVRCDAAAEERAIDRALLSWREGENVALVSDAGTPGISDPGARLIAAAHTSDTTVIPIPGPSAVTAALSAAGFRAVPFRFVGFPPRKSGARARAWVEILREAGASVFFESPVRLPRTLTELATLDPDRPVFVGRELSKLHEELYRGTLREAAERFAGRPPRGECTVVVAPPPKRPRRPTLEEE